MQSRRGSISTHTSIQPPILFHTSPASSISEQHITTPKPRRNSVSFLTPQSTIEQLPVTIEQSHHEDIKEIVQKNKNGIKSLTSNLENLSNKVASVEARKECECSKFESIYRSEFKKEIDALKRDIKHLSDELKNIIES